MVTRHRAFSLRTDDLPEEHQLQAQFALAAFNTLKAKKIAYISVPITSGRRLYDYMDEHGYKTPQEATQTDPADFFRNVVQPNLAAGVAAGEAWSKAIDGAVVAPAEFEKKLRSHKDIGWGQDDFMGMWLPLIDEKITHMVMLDGWEYSNGSGEEYLQAVLMQMGRRDRSNIEIVDARGHPLPLDEGIRLLAEAFTDLQARGLKPRNMAETLSLLLEAEKRFDREKTTGRSAEPPFTEQHPSKEKPTVPAYSHGHVRDIAAQVDNTLRQWYPDIQPILDRTSSFDFSPLNALFRPKKPQHKKPPGPPPRKPAGLDMAA